MALFFLDGLRLVFSSWGQFPKMVRQVFFIGVKSISVITLIALFTGMVIGLQTFYALSKFGAEGFLGTAVALSLVRELGPVLTAIMLTGRAGSSMTAEIGVMRITEQIDALDVMAINPMSFLVSPKLAASLVSFPLLTAWFDLVGIAGGVSHRGHAHGREPRGVHVAGAGLHGLGGHLGRIRQGPGFWRGGLHRVLLQGLLHPLAQGRSGSRGV